MTNTHNFVMIILKNFLLTFCLFIAAATFGYGQFGDSECKKFRTGTFSYKEEFVSVIIERTKKKQKELEIISGLELHYKIKWTSDCEYKLIQTWSNNAELNKRKGMVLTVRITAVGADSYQYICDDGELITRNTIVKIKQ